MEEIAGGVPPPRRSSLRTLRDRAGAVLDRAVVLWFEGPRTATGEDLVELHCHGGLAITRAVERALGAIDGLRAAEPGEFTRRAFENGRIDLAEAEGLADLLAAETELQRLSAQENFGGSLSRSVAQWRKRLIDISAGLEALMDFSDEDDVAVDLSDIVTQAKALRAELEKVLGRPSVERLRNGVRVVLAGPPNSGKSSLFNTLLEDDAAIVSATAGTTRDTLERSVALDGVPIVLVDTAGVHEESQDEIERIGIERARTQFERADILLWFGPVSERPAGAITVRSKSDMNIDPRGQADFNVSSVTGNGIRELVDSLARRSRSMLPKPGVASLNERQQLYTQAAARNLAEIEDVQDPLIVAESLRRTRVAFDSITGHGSTEAMLDTIFAGFCIGK